MDIELRLLRSFVQIFESRSLSRAADRLACTQSAMSMRLKMLEVELGAPLFFRYHHRLEPTLRGSELYAKALGVLAAYDEMMSLTRNRPHRERLRIGMPDDYAMGFLGPLLQDLGTALARYEIDVSCDLSANLMAGLARQELDLALVTLAAPPSRAEAVFEAPLNWVMHSAASPEAAVLAAYPEGCVFRRAMIGALEAAGVGWQVAAQSRSHAAIMAAVRAGVAVTSAARGTAPPDLVEVACTSVLPKLAPVPIYLVAAAAARPAARQAQEALERVLRRCFGRSVMTGRRRQTHWNAAKTAARLPHENGCSTGQRRPA